MLRQRLAEAITWCAGRVGALDPGDALWMPALRPASLPERPPYAAIVAWYRGQRGPPPGRSTGLADHPLAGRVGVIDDLTRARAAALASTGCAPGAPADDLAGGRLLLFAPDESASDGAAELQTRGFFDGDNTPGWDTWVWSAVDPTRTAENARRATGPGGWVSIGFADYLVAWAPPELLALVDAGVRINPEGCIAWADEVDTALTRRLRVAGLL